MRTRKTSSILPLPKVYNTYTQMMLHTLPICAYYHHQHHIYTTTICGSNKKNEEEKLCMEAGSMCYCSYCISQLNKCTTVAVAVT